MRILLLLLSLCVLATGARAQTSDPGAQQDAEAAREKLLRASDQLDNMQANSEATRQALDGMKANLAQMQADMAKLQTDNAALKQQLADQQTAFEQYKLDQTKTRQTLIDNVADMIAASHDKASKHHKDAPSPDADADTPSTSGMMKSPSADTSAGNLAPPPDAPTAGSDTPSAPADPDSGPVRHPKGYYHVVASGETLSLICNAYRDSGVNVTTADVRRANGLTKDSVLKVGEKLFIPKPGT